MALDPAASFELARSLSLLGGLSLAAFGASRLAGFLARRHRARNPLQAHTLRDAEGRRLRFDLDDRHSPAQRAAALRRAVKELERRARFDARAKGG